MSRAPIRTALALALVAVPSALIGAALTIPHAFTDNTVASAAQVNANFDAVKTAHDANDMRIQNLETGGIGRLVGQIVWTATTSSWQQNPGPSTLTTFAAVTGNSATTRGAASVPATQIPGILFASLPAGTYRVEATSYFSGWTGGIPFCFAFTDGSVWAPERSCGYPLAIGAGVSALPSVIGTFEYASPQTNLLLEIGGTGMLGYTSRLEVAGNGSVGNPVTLVISVYRVA